MPQGLPTAACLASVFLLGDTVSPHHVPGPGLQLGGTQSSHALAISVTSGGQARQGTLSQRGWEKAELLVRAVGPAAGRVLQQVPGPRGRSPAWPGVGGGQGICQLPCREPKSWSWLCPCPWLFFSGYYMLIFFHLLSNCLLFTFPFA